MSNPDAALQELKKILNPPRKAFLVYVDLDPVPGTFHTPHSAYQNILGILDSHISQYEPTAILVSQTKTTSGRTRVCFVVHANLDPTPGTFHTLDSARNVIGRILNERIAHYNPIVSVAPAAMQIDAISAANKHPRIPLSGLDLPNNIEGNN